MNLYICEICGDAYIGAEKPTDCPFCGAKNGFIKEYKEAKPVINETVEISDESKKNLEETLALEIKATAIYTCMAGKSKDYATMKMFKRLAKVELEHAIICTKILKIDMPEINPQICSDEDIENFKKTIELEDHASELYKKFTQKSKEGPIKKLFGALTQVEQNHIELIKTITK